MLVVRLLGYLTFFSAVIQVFGYPTSYAPFRLMTMESLRSHVLRSYVTNTNDIEMEAWLGGVVKVLLAFLGKQRFNLRP